MKKLYLSALIPTTCAVLLAFGKDQEPEPETRQWLLVADTSGSYPVWAVFNINHQADLGNLYSVKSLNDAYTISLYEIWKALDMRINGGLQMTIPTAKRFRAPSSALIQAERNISNGVEEIPQLFLALHDCMAGDQELQLGLLIGQRPLPGVGDNVIFPEEEWGSWGLHLPDYGGYWPGPSFLVLQEGARQKTTEFIFDLTSTLADHLEIPIEQGNQAKLEPLLEEVLRRMGHRNPKVMKLCFGGWVIESSPPVPKEIDNPENPFGPKIEYEGSVYDYDLGGQLSVIYLVAKAMALEKEAVIEGQEQ